MAVGRIIALGSRLLLRRRTKQGNSRGQFRFSTNRGIIGGAVGAIGRRALGRGDASRRGGRRRDRQSDRADRFENLDDTLDDFLEQQEGEASGDLQSFESRFERRRSGESANDFFARIRRRFRGRVSESTFSTIRQRLSGRRGGSRAANPFRLSVRPFDSIYFATAEDILSYPRRTPTFEGPVGKDIRTHVATFDFETDLAPNLTFPETVPEETPRQQIEEAKKIARRVALKMLRRQASTLEIDGVENGFYEVRSNGQVYLHQRVANHAALDFADQLRSDLLQMGGTYIDTYLNMLRVIVDDFNDFERTYDNSRVPDSFL